MPLEVGSRLGPYEILAPLGAGGMGEVYRARDTSLRRDVAIKVLPAYWSHDPDRLRRFELEAQSAAALNHPNIVSIFYVGQHDGSPYIITELLQGETLRDRLRRGPMRLGEVLDFGGGITRGLAAAQDAGIVHRDLKPENIFVTKEGRVKILDFGLAKLAPARAATGDDKTITFLQQSSPGQVLGTSGYMSPEQVRAEAADARSDIFSIGIVLYEMLTGQRPFRKSTPVETMAAILSEDPPAMSQLTPTAPPGFQKIVNRCLAKSPEHRFQHASDLAFALEALSDSSSRAIPARTDNGSPKRKSIWIAASLAILAMAAALVFWGSRPPAVPVVEAITQLTDDGEAKGYHNSLQTDGSRIFFNEGRMGSLRIAQIAVVGGPTAVIPAPVADAQPVGIAPDGSSLLVLQGGSAPPPKPVWEVPLPTGEPRRLGNLEAQDGSITPDGRILFSQAGDLYISENGSDARKIVSGIEGFVGDPAMSPDGKRIVFTRYPVAGDPELFEVDSDGSRIGLLARSREPGGFCCAQWTPDEKYIVFETRVRTRQDLWYLPMKRGLLQRTSEPMRLTAGPLSYSDPIPSRDGKQIFTLGTRQRGELVRYDMNSKLFVPFLSGISASNLTFSKEGNWVAYLAYPDQTLWRSRSDGRERLQLTPMGVGHPAISPDGKRVAYQLNGSLYLISMEGGQPQTIVDGKSPGRADWSPDGNVIVFFTSPDHDHNEANFLDLRTGKRSVVPGSSGVGEARWVGDDMLVAAGPGSKGFVVFDGNTQTWSTLAFEAKSNPIMSWSCSPDFQYLYYTTGGPEPEVARIRLADRKVETIASLKDFHFAAYPQVHAADTQVNVAPDGSIIFTRDIGTQEIYALNVKWP